jgi:hypothetical protein
MARSSEFTKQEPEHLFIPNKPPRKRKQNLQRPIKLEEIDQSEKVSEQLGEVEEEEPPEEEVEEDD